MPEIAAFRPDVGLRRIADGKKHTRNIFAHIHEEFEVARLPAVPRFSDYFLIKSDPDVFRQGHFLYEE